jgi:hypothetical protein
MPETEWNSTTTPEKGSIVYVLALDNIGQYVQRHTLGWTSSEGADHSNAKGASAHRILPLKPRRRSKLNASLV